MNTLQTSYKITSQQLANHETFSLRNKYGQEVLMTVSGDWQKGFEIMGYWPDYSPIHYCPFIIPGFMTVIAREAKVDVIIDNLLAISEDV